MAHDFQADTKEADTSSGSENNFFQRHSIGIYQITSAIARYSLLGITVHGAWRGSIRETALGLSAFGIVEIIHYLAEKDIRDGYKQRYENLRNSFLERLFRLSDKVEGLERTVVSDDQFQQLPPEDNKNIPN